MNRARRWPAVLRVMGTAVLAAAVLACFFTALGHLNGGQTEEGRLQLERSLRRSAVACYAAEGVYPPTVAYLEEHYGVQVDTSRYVVDYNAFAENLMPDITVLEKETG